MRLYQRNGIYYVEFERGNKQSLKTTDEKLAKSLFDRMYRERLLGRLVRLDPSPNITLEDFTKEYLKSRICGSELTRDQDSLALRQLASVLGGKTLLKSIDSNKIKKFVSTSVNVGLGDNPKPLAPASINSYLRHIKVAFRSAVEDGYLKQAPTIKLLKTGKHLPRYLRPDKIKAILAKAEELKPEFAKRLHFYLWTGARRNEAKNLTWQDVNLRKTKNPRVTLNGKGDKQRVVPLMPPIVKILKTIKRHENDDFVFGPLHEDTISHWFKAIALACDPPIDARLHDLRHTAATYMLASGVPLEIVQEIMGHEDIATTQIYAKVVEEQMHRQMKKLKFELD